MKCSDLYRLVLLLQVAPPRPRHRSASLSRLRLHTTKHQVKQGACPRYIIGQTNKLSEQELVHSVQEWVIPRVYRLIPCSRMSRSGVPCPSSTTTSAPSRPAAAAEYIHNEVANGDDYSCDSVYDGNEHLCGGRA